MDTQEKNNFIDLYSSSDRTSMQAAEKAKDTTKDRLDELISFAKAQNINTIGIANCIAFQKEANQTVSYLQSNGFTVHSVDCKLGKIPSSEFNPEAKGISCNPIGQAKLLEKFQTGINISFGLCVGHDMLFNQHTKALATTLIVKDRRLNHKTIERFTIAQTD